MKVSVHGAIVCKVILVVIYYVGVLLFIGPVIDHSFTSLHKDDSNLEILSEVMFQLVAVSLTWFYLSSWLFEIGNRVLNMQRVAGIKGVIGIVSGLMLVGLQTNLLDKLTYITKEHPFRFIQLFDNITPTIGIHQ
jgi:hypothetical protein